MDLSRTAQDLTIGYRGIVMLAYFNHGQSVADQSADVADFLNAPAGCQEFTDPGTGQKFRVWYNLQSTVVLALGALTRAADADLVTGYIIGPDPNNPQGFNSSAQVIARRLFNSILGDAFGGAKRMFFFGHSFGGVVVNALAAIVATQPGPPNISVITYGSPKPGNRNAQLAIATVDSWRWMADGDKITTVPPTPAQAPLLNALLGRSASVTCQQFGHLTEGTFINDTGGMVTILEQDFPGVFTDLSLLNFVINASSPTAVNHQIVNYERSLTIAYHAAVRAAMPAVEPIPGPVMGPRVQPAVPPGDVVFPDLLGAAVARVPQNPNYNTSELPYYHEKEGTMWAVKSNGLEFAVCKTAKQARALARALNTSWRKWNSALAGSAEAFESTVQENFLN